VGYDRVDVPAATRHRVAVAITPTANHECVAEHAMALLLAVTRQIVGHHADVLRGDWTRRVMLPLRGRTLGLVGLGRIGRSMALRARGFRMNLLAYDEFPNRAFAEEHQIRLVDFPTLLAESDYVTLHAPLTPATHGLMNARTFAQMKPGALLINTARGGLVVEADLVDALRRGQLGGAGLDVFEQEPTPVDNPLLSLPNVVASPHYAGGDVLSNQEMATESARNIVALFRGEWPEGAIVNEQRWDLNAPRT
jgi:D-3-phosphoglycerate dehydrogenase/(S)-sulfolactate dehydrogenase